MFQVIRMTGATLVLAMFAMLSFNTQAATFPTLAAGEHTFFSYNEPGKFKDRWKFSLAQDSKVSVRITDLEQIAAGVKLQDNKKLFGKFDGFKFGEGEWATATLLAGINYTFIVKGKAVGLFGGTYQLDTKVAPVPVPAALGLFAVALAGFFRLRSGKANVLAA